MMNKILFLHGFFASGSCVPANALKQYFDGKAKVLTPDLPLHPGDAIKEIRAIIDREHPTLLVGNSCGSFYAQQLSPIVGIPAMLGNPHFEMSQFLKERLESTNTNLQEQMGNRLSSSTKLWYQSLRHLKRSNSTIATLITGTESGDCLEKTIHWLITNRLSLNTTTNPSTSQVLILRQNRK